MPTLGVRGHRRGFRMCVHRDSNPNLNLGRVKYYPCTMDATKWPARACSGFQSGGFGRIEQQQLNIKKKIKVSCVHRDSNPNLILGRDKYYPCTMDACEHSWPEYRYDFKEIVFRNGAIRCGFASIAQLAEHALSKRKVTSSILVGGFQCSYGLAWL